TRTCLHGTRPVPGTRTWLRETRPRPRDRRRPPAGVLALERQLGIPRPLVPRPRVVARVVARASERERGERRARARVAVRDDLRPLRRTDELADPLGRERPALVVEERVDLHASRAGDVALSRVARAAPLARVLLLAADVEQRERGVVEARRELLPRRQGAGVRL